MIILDGVTVTYPFFWALIISSEDFNTFALVPSVQFTRFRCKGLYS